MKNKGLLILLLFIMFASVGICQTRPSILQITTVDTIADLRLAVPTIDKTFAIVNGHTTTYDGGGGDFLWDNTNTTADNNGTIILPTGHTGAGRWRRNYQGSVNVLWFGTPRGTTLNAEEPPAGDASVGIQAAVDWAARNTPLGDTRSGRTPPTESVYIPAGMYRINNTITVAKTGAVIYGDGDSTCLMSDSASFTGANATYPAVIESVDGTTYRPSVAQISLTVRDMKIFGRLTYLETQTPFIPTIHGIRIRGVTSLGSGVTSAFNRLSFHGCEAAIDMGYCWNIDISNVSFTGGSNGDYCGSGIAMGSYSSVGSPSVVNAITIQNCIFQYLDYGLIGANGRCTRIRDSSLQDLDTGIKYFSVSSLIIRNNYFENVTNYGIDLGYITPSPNKAVDQYQNKNCVVENNNLQGTPLGGFLNVRNAHALVFRNNWYDNVNTAVASNTLAISINIETIAASGTYWIVNSDIEFWNAFNLTYQANRIECQPMFEGTLLRNLWESRIATEPSIIRAIDLHPYTGSGI